MLKISCSLSESPGLTLSPILNNGQLHLVVSILSSWPKTSKSKGDEKEGR